MGNRKTIAEMFPRCSWHQPSTLGYLESFDDADKRLVRGEEQIYCDDCHRWYWPDEWGRNPNRKAKG